MSDDAMPCTVQNVHHIGIAVRDVRAALAFYQDTFGLPASAIEEAPEHGIRATFVDIGGVHLELIEPLQEDSVMGKFIAQRGEGLHHICLSVDNIVEKVDLLKSKGMRMVDQQPRKGLRGEIAFLHPRATHGVLIELVQPFD